MSGIKPPRAKFTVGDEVDVRIDEAGNPPSYRATVVGVYWQRQGILEYAVEDEAGQRTDSYPEDWLSLAI